MPADAQSAKEICEIILDRTGAAVVAGDFAAFACHFILPFRLETIQGIRTIDQEHDFRSVFNAVHSHMTQMRVTLMARHCIAAEHRDKDTIIGTHETRLISHGQLIEDPFPVMSIFSRQPDDSWKCHTASYDVPEGSLYRSALQA